MRLHRSALIALILTSSLAAAPSLSAVYNGAGWMPAGLPNSGIAQGAIFSVIGTGMGPTTLVEVSQFPLPTSQGLSGTSMQVTVNSVTENCIMIYTSEAAVTGVLPSATPIGTGTLRLTYQGNSATIPITVVKANFGTLTLNEGGTGPAVITDINYNPITMINPAYPGQDLILWGSGLGPTTGDETEAPPQVDLQSGVQIWIGNQKVPASGILYGGRSNFVGLDQIDFTVPTTVNPGCKTSIVVSVNGITGNVTTTAIAPQGQSTCGDTYNALTSANLQNAITTGFLNLGGVQLSSVDGNGGVSAVFGSYPINSLIRSQGGSFGASAGSCQEYEVVGSTLVLPEPILPSPLSAGAALTLNGPGGAKNLPATSEGVYSNTLAAGYLAPGQYSVGNGAGGSNVSSFNWSSSLPSNVVPTNIPSSFNRSQDLTLTWTGGSQFPIVSILVYSIAVVNGNDVWAYMICSADGPSQSFTIPAPLLAMMPSNGYGKSGAPGVNIQIAGISTTRFSGSSAGGLDTGFFDALISSGSVVPNP